MAVPYTEAISYRETSWDPMKSWLAPHSLMPFYVSSKDANLTAQKKEEEDEVREKISRLQQGKRTDVWVPAGQQCITHFHHCCEFRSTTCLLVEREWILLLLRRRRRRRFRVCRPLGSVFFFFLVFFSYTPQISEIDLCARLSFSKEWIDLSRYPFLGLSRVLRLLIRIFPSFFLKA